MPTHITHLVLQEELRLRVQLVAVALLDHGQLLELLETSGVLEGLQAAQHLEGASEQVAQAPQSSQRRPHVRGTRARDLWGVRRGRSRRFPRDLQIKVISTVVSKFGCSFASPERRKGRECLTAWPGEAPGAHALGVFGEGEFTFSRR